MGKYLDAAGHSASITKKQLESVNGQFTPFLYFKTQIQGVVSSGGWADIY